ncbi:diguanylate cyclase [Paraliomyxa miuraensis]|uniref:diguanylate cyclase n=1 Tax=Paraliomyxa miuraensis TaxID=376150 RepID=UPI002256A392|nr:diguanylate cyclase [Paraliomyxa miuraensis]MCX4240738.1 diguanylate cyclase [Paraliomyxa miuraensis]
MKPLQDLEHARILVVDDEPVVAESTAAILRELGHDVTVAHRWTDALRAFDPLATDLVLMDAVMPNMDGLKLTRLLREQSQSYVPTVFLTGLRTAEIRAQCANAGADDFLTKPVDALELCVRVKAMLRIRALTRALEDKTRELERTARTDPLTGVGNRRVFDERLVAEVARSRRHGRPLALLMFDLDHFKQINDRHGHLVGDDLLSLFGTILREGLRASDLPCRYGGEEFLLIAPETTGERARAVAERIRLEYRARTAVRGTVGPQTVSVGISASDVLEVELSERSLLAAADEALYRAKALGRDRVELGSRPNDAEV